MNRTALDALLKQGLAKNGSPVPARLQAALALLERLRTSGALRLEEHLSEAGQSLVSHETYGDAAHERLGIEKINKNHGRRSSSIHEWGQGLLDIVSGEGFVGMKPRQRSSLLDAMQGHLAASLRKMLDSEPITVRIKGRTAEAVIADVLEQAEAKGRIGPVAQYLVGAKLQLRFPNKRTLIAAHGSNKGDRKSRAIKARRGDFDLGEYVFEIAAGSPDAKHIDQMAAILQDSDAEAWLIVRGDRQQFWKDELVRAEVDMRRVVVAAIELFVGQNITELGELSARGKAEQLTELFNIYNDAWIATLGSPGMRIVAK